MSFSASPGVLIAVPQLLDPNFHRSVVLMLEHDADGALGLVINHDTSHLCAEVVSNFDLPWNAAADATLCRGGPVEPHSLWMLHADDWVFGESTLVVEGVAVSRSREALTRLCEGGTPRMRMLIGYAGWGAGQLEQEFAQGSWITAPATAEMVFDWPLDSIWRRALGSVGVDPAHLVGGGGGVH